MLPHQSSGPAQDRGAVSALVTVGMWTLCILFSLLVWMGVLLALIALL
jgi:hypothetical protein